MDMIPRNDYGERCQFDAYCKLVLYHEAIDYLREMQRRRDRELSFSDLPQMEIKKRNDDMDEDNIITLNDENGNEVEFEFLDLIPYRQNEYVVLLPIGDSDGQVVILQLKEIDDETEEYVGVENEFVLETVFALFKERNKDFFTFE